VPRGFEVDIITELARATGRDMRIELLPWDVAQKKVLEGQGDMVIGMSITDERKKLWDFATPTLTHSFSLFVEDYDVAIKGMDDLRGKRVGVTAGGLPRKFMEGRPGVKVTLIDNYREGFELLKKGAIDAFAGDTLVGGYILNIYHIEGISVAGKPFATLDSAIAVPRVNGKLLREIDRGIAILEKRGVIERIRKKWEPKQVIFLRREQIHRILIFSVFILGAVLLAVMTGWIATLIREIRVRRRTEDDLRLNEQKFRVLFEEAPDAILVHDLDLGRFVDANAKAELLFGYSRKELLNSGPERFYPPEQPDNRPVSESVHENGERVLAGEKLVFERIIRNAEGKDLTCEVRLVGRTQTDTRKLSRYHRTQKD
jgi:PAS domain S-box-containing protein